MVPARRLFLLVFVMVCCVPLAGAASSASDFSDALKARDIAKVRNLLAASADLNEKVRGDYPLNVAATFGPAEMVTVLLDAGADIEKPGREGFRPLHNAVAMGHKDIVALLLRTGTLVDARDRMGRTPLYRFASMPGGDIEIAKMLLAAGADPDSTDEDQVSVLRSAALVGNPELGKLLIAAHADVNHVDSSGKSALHNAVFYARHDFAKLLIAAGANVNLQNVTGKAPLAVARDEAMRQILINAGAK